VNGELNEENAVLCKPGWTGPSCEEKSCFKDCSKNGICENGII
jgi:hypothetical protein